MSVVLRWFGGAAEASGTDEESYEPGPLSGVLDAARERHGASVSQVLPRCSVLVDGRNAEGDDPHVSAGSVVDVLPPFAGG